ncbi:MAG: hypothetical protein ACKV2T_20320 [Kofleriaceae bacterium]
MFVRVACTVSVLLLCNCSRSREEAKPIEAVAPAPQILPIDAVAPAPVASAIAAWTGPDAGDAWANTKPRVEGEYRTQHEQFLDGGYLALLWVDHFFGEMLVSFPGAAPTNRYYSGNFGWDVPDLDKVEKALRRANATSSYPIDTATVADRAVSAYTATALDVWPDLRGLAEYYKEKRFVDDEFARGRSEGRLVAEAIEKMTPLRKPMSEGVFAGWREVAGDKPESARAIAGASFEACIRAAFDVFDAATIRRKSKTTNPQTEVAIDARMSVCRKAVGAVSALPASFHPFAQSLRKAAIAFGDASHSDWAVKHADDELLELVNAYIEQWPKLPSEPAEKPQDR